jgi:hypothetical protein
MIVFTMEENIDFMREEKNPYFMGHASDTMYMFNATEHHQFDRQ